MRISHDIRAEAEKQQGMAAMAEKFREAGQLYIPAEPAE
jgi:phosphomethylpyrimidine synthase